MKKIFILFAVLSAFAILRGAEKEPVWALYPVLNQTSNVMNADNAVTKMYRERKKLDAEALEIGKTPLLTDADIRFYDGETNRFMLKPGVRAKKLKEWQVPTNGLWFVMKADGKKQFAGAFWSDFSSLSCFEPVINISRLLFHPVLGFRPGYPFVPDEQKKTTYASGAVQNALKKSGKLLGDPLSRRAAQIFFDLMEKMPDFWHPFDADLVSDDYDTKTGRLSEFHYAAEKDFFSLYFSARLICLDVVLPPDRELLYLQFPGATPVYLIVIYDRNSPNVKKMLDRLSAMAKK